MTATSLFNEFCVDFGIAIFVIFALDMILRWDNIDDGQRMFTWQDAKKNLLIAVAVAVFNTLVF